MIVTLIGIVVTIIIISLMGRIMNKDEEKANKTDVPVMLILMWGGLPVAIAIIITGIFADTKMGEWEVKEAIGSTLLDDKEESILNGYTYQYIIPDRWSTKPDIMNYTVNDLSEDAPPILVKCERKAEPTIWTLGLGHKETRYVFYNSNDIISEIELK